MGPSRPGGPIVCHPFCLCASEFVQREILIGSTNNLERRLPEHNTGDSKSTKGGRARELVYQDFHDTLVSARRRESELRKRKNHAYMDEQSGLE